MIRPLDVVVWASLAAWCALLVWIVSIALGPR